MCCTNMEAYKLLLCILQALYLCTRIHSSPASLLLAQILIMTQSWV